MDDIITRRMKKGKRYLGKHVGKKEEKQTRPLMIHT
jgi:hypothetical protein